MNGPLCYHCCLRMLAVMLFALRHEHIGRCQCRFHGDNFFENVPGGRAAKIRKINEQLNMETK